ncbi:hypothetical protein BpHYR1_007225 [Brachionus plicatilis]|uniref:Uncharacterized protein n=1 Tax=Brachionus plicatilis TaxID=10195 RepID=A0A3M7R9M9_BRAPC|nr:hypothetical protein BpHYR1_007225 [Brachionus plicatilis]
MDKTLNIGMIIDKIRIYSKHDFDQLCSKSSVFAKLDNSSNLICFFRFNLSHYSSKRIIEFWPSLRKWKFIFTAQNSTKVVTNAILQYINYFFMGYLKVPFDLIS